MPVYFYITVVIVLFLIFICYKLSEINNILIKAKETDETITPSLLVKTKTNIFSQELIPKIIIQTWKTNVVPQRYIPLIDSVKKNNPDYEYMFFTDENIVDFFKTNYPEYYKTYLNLPIKIQRIDFFRYVAVYHYGGFYLDLDMLYWLNYFFVLYQKFKNCCRVVLFKFIFNLHLKKIESHLIF